MKYSIYSFKSCNPILFGNQNPSDYILTDLQAASKSTIQYKIEQVFKR